MHEEWERTKDRVGAVREGLATTGKVITAAAAIMIVVFGAFMLSPDRMLQQFGLGPGRGDPGRRAGHPLPDRARP